MALIFLLLLNKLKQSSSSVLLFGGPIFVCLSSVQ